MLFSNTGSFCVLGRQLQEFSHNRPGVTFKLFWADGLCYNQSSLLLFQEGRQMAKRWMCMAVVHQEGRSLQGLVLLSRGRGAISGHISNPQWTGCCWHLVGAAQGCCSKSWSVQNSPIPQQRLIWPNTSIAPRVINKIFLINTSIWILYHFTYKKYRSLDFFQLLKLKSTVGQQAIHMLIAGQSGKLSERRCGKPQ